MTLVFKTSQRGGSYLKYTFYKLHNHTLPKTALNFANYANGVQIGNKLVSYKGTTFHKIIPGLLIQGGDIIGCNNKSSYGNYLKDEGFYYSHSDSGILSMANEGKNTNGCQFFITTGFCDWFDKKHVAFGEIESGMQVLNEIVYCGSTNGTPKKIVTIIGSGTLK